MLKKKAFFLILLVFSIWGHIGCIAENYVDISTLKEQANITWTEQYTDKFERKISIDITPIIGEINRVPILIVEKPLVSEENIMNVFDVALATKEDDEASTVWYYEDKTTKEQIQVSISKGVKNRLLIRTGWKD